MQAAVAQRLLTDTPTLTAFVADRNGRAVDDLEVQVSAGAIAGGLLATMRHWHASGYAEPLDELLDRTSVTLQVGLEVAAAPGTEG